MAGADRRAAVTVRVRYHQEGSASWWAESPDLEGWTAAADSLAALRELVREAVGMLRPDDAALVEEVSRPGDS